MMTRRRNHLISLILALALCALIFILAPAPSLAQAENQSYYEDFNNDTADGWYLDTAYWQVRGGALFGSGHGWATYNAGTWSDMKLSFTLWGLNGALHANVLVSGPNPDRYIVGLQNEGDFIHIYLQKQVGSDFSELASADFPFTREDFKMGGLGVEIVVEGQTISVWLNGEQLIAYDDPERLPSGAIAFETLDNSDATVDNVGVEPIAQEPGRGQPDLVILNVEAVDFQPGSVIIIFRVEIANQGEGASPPVALVIHDESEQAFGSSQIGGLQPGENRNEEVRVEAPDSWWGTSHSFIAQLDPDGMAQDSNPDNNVFATGNIQIPERPGGGEPGGGQPGGEQPGGGQPGGGQPGPTGIPGWLILIVIVAVVGVVGVAVAGVTLRSVLNASERKQWEQHAKQEHPPDECQPPQRYCEVETHVEVKLMKVTQLEVVSTDPQSSEQRRKQSLKDQLPDGLRHAILAHKLREAPDKFATRLDNFSREMGAALAQFAQHEPTPCDLAVSAHLEGLEVTSTFTLYRCTGQPGKGRWKRVASWDVKKQQERDDEITAVKWVDAQSAALVQRLAAEVNPLLRQYIERYFPL